MLSHLKTPFYIPFSSIIIDPVLHTLSNSLILFYEITFMIFALLYSFSAGLAVHIKTNNPVSTPEEVEVLFDSLHRDILSKNFSNILSMASRERIDKLKYPQKMQNMQKLAVQDVAKSDKLRKKVSPLY